MEGMTLGKYRILRELGRGGMGVVYEAEHGQVRHRVAIKVLDPLLARNPEQAARVRVEGIAANLPRHPGIVQVLETDNVDGTPYIVMELVAGESLRELLVKEGGRLEVLRVVRLAKQLADAFAAAHDVGIVHRDVKPDKFVAAYKWCREFLLSMENRREVTAEPSEFLWWKSRSDLDREHGDARLWFPGLL